MKKPVQVGMIIFLLGVRTLIPSESPSNGSPPERSGVEPSSKKNCPISHPIKGNFTTDSGERCIYHVPGQRFYLKTNPERCYATEEEAILDGCRPSKVWRPKTRKNHGSDRKVVEKKNQIDTFFASSKSSALEMPLKYLKYNKIFGLFHSRA